jgi:hypothetical protein
MWPSRCNKDRIEDGLGSRGPDVTGEVVRGGAGQKGHLRHKSGIRSERRAILCESEEML